MHRVDATNHYNNTFTDGNAQTGIAPTTLAADWHNSVQEEIANVVEFTGDTLDRSDNTQLLTNLIPHVGGMTALRAIAPVSGYRVYLKYHTTAGDGGHGVFRGVTGASAATYTHNGGTILVPSGGDGSAAWLREYSGAIDARWFGAIGDNSTTNTTVLQSWLTASAGKTCQLLDGTYLSGSLTISSGTRMVGNGTLKAISGLGDSSTLLINSTISGSANTYYDSDIIIDGVTFDGNGVGSSQSRSTSIVAFLKTRRVTLRNCVFKNAEYQGVQIAGCRDTVIDKCFLTGFGKTSVTAEGGSALWIGAASGSESYDTRVTNCTFSDNEWSGIYSTSERTIVDHCTFYNNKESSIFDTGTFNTYSNNVIHTTTKKNISASGLECGGSNLVISGNLIYNTASSGISLTDVQHAVISGNTIKDPAQDAVSFPTGGGITVITTASSGSQPKWLEINGNSVLGTTATLPYTGIEIGNSGAAVQYVVIQNNNLAGTAWTNSKAITIASGKWGTGCIRQNNAGSTDETPYSTEFHGNSATGAQSVTGVGFKPRRIEVHALKTSGTTVEQCKTVINSSGTCNCHTWSADGTNAYGSTTGNKFVTLYTPAGVNEWEATFTSYDDDGFTIDVTTGGFQPWIQFVAYP